MLEGSVSPLPRSLAVPLGGVRRLSTTTALAGVVLGSFLIRWLLALGRPTPTLFPDEYIYAALARALSGGDLSVRGTPAHFPALLEPLLAAPLWLTGDAEIAYRLTQGLHSLAMSLAAVPVYVLARRVGIRPGYALAAGALAVLSPDLLYSSFLLADPIGYPVALTAVYLGVRALAQPTGRLQLAFLAACGLATFARVQYVVLPAAFVLSALVVERGSGGRPRGRDRTTVGLLLAGPVSIGAVGLNRVLGYYEDVLALDLNAQLLGRWLALDLLFLALAAGVVLVPGAAAGLAAGIARPRTREEAAFASFVAATAGILLFQAALFAANGAEKFQERYLMILLPLAAISFLLFVGRRPSRPARLGVVAVGAALVLGASTTPIAAQPVDASPFLLGGAWLTLRIGEEHASLIVAAGAALLAGLGVLAALRVRGWAAAGVAVAAVTSATISLAAAGFDGSNSRAVLSTTMAADPSWVDQAGRSPVALVQLPNGRRHREILRLVSSGFRGRP